MGTAAFHIANNSSHSGYREAKFTFPFDEEWPTTRIKPIRLMYIRHASQSSFNGGIAPPSFPAQLEVEQMAALQSPWLT